MEDFIASSSWCYKWKKRHRIVSRKATRVVSAKNIREAAQVKESGEQFVNRIKNLIEAYGESNVYNTDQTGFKIENNSGRTLEQKGLKQIEIAYQQSKSATHSYTVQPVISAKGKLFPKFLVVLPEQAGQFVVRVGQRMFKHQMIVARANRSGIVTKEIIRDFYDLIFYPNCGEQCLLLYDSLPAYKDQTYYDEVRPDHIDCHVETIPAGTTGQVQALDVGFFRSYKSFHLNLTHFTLLKCRDILVYNRDNILRLILATHIQFCAPRFEVFIRHCFVQSGYLKRLKKDHFEDPREYCFHQNVRRHMCNYDACEEKAMLRCAWCEKYICMRHLCFDTNVHFCCEDEIFSE